MTVELATFGVWELILILLIVVVIFGAGKLPQLGESMGKAGRAKVLERYQWDTIVQNYYEPIFST